MLIVFRGCSTIAETETATMNNESTYNIHTRSSQFIAVELENNEPQNMDAVSLNDTTDAAMCSNLSLSDCKSIVSEYQNEHWFTTEMEALMIFFYCLVMVLGIFGNTLVCYVVIRFKHLRQSRNILILNLAVCGIIMCIASMPFSLVRLTLKNWHLGDVMCRVAPTLQTVNVFVSTFTIVAIAVDRYSAIVCATQDSVKSRLVYYWIVLMWLASIILCVPMLIFHEVHEAHSSVADMKLYKICMEVWPSEIWKKLYTTFVLLFQYIAPLAIISTLHGRICQFLRLRIQFNPRTERETLRVLRDIKRHKRNMLLLTAIAISFALAWLPLTILNTLADYDYTLFMDRNFNQVYGYSLLVAMCSACLNPILYGWFNTNFRQAFLRVLCCRKKEVGDNLEMASIHSGSKITTPQRYYSSLERQRQSRSKAESSPALACDPSPAQ